MGTKSLLLYVHVPFCPSKCHFCGWVQNIPVRELRLNERMPPRVRYIQSVKEQIRHFAPVLERRGYRPELIYWGGGTPSVLTPDEFTDIMTTLDECFDLSGVAEASIESSPDTLDAEKLAAYRAAGFDRISMGVQSFDDERLRQQGRSHRSEHVHTAVTLARAAGFTNINLDLMCGFPGEQLGELESSVRAVLDLAVPHVSLYPYAPAENTVLYRQLNRGQVKLSAEESKAAYRLGRTLLEDGGLPEYAMSYFSHRPCRADMAYYRLEMDWMGFGAGATSLIDGTSLLTHRSLERYGANPTLFAERRPASAPEVATALLFQGLASFDGIDARLWRERVGVPLEETMRHKAIAPAVDMLRGMSELIQDAQGIRLARASIAESCIDARLMSTPQQGVLV